MCDYYSFFIITDSVWEHFDFNKIDTYCEAMASNTSTTYIATFNSIQFFNY